MILGFEYLEGGVEVRVQQLKGYAYVLAKYKPVNHVNTYDVVRMVLESLRSCSPTLFLLLCSRHGRGVPLHLEGYNVIDAVSRIRVPLRTVQRFRYPEYG